MGRISSGQELILLVVLHLFLKIIQMGGADFYSCREVEMKRLWVLRSKSRTVENLE